MVKRHRALHRAILRITCIRKAPKAGFDKPEAFCGGNKDPAHMPVMGELSGPAAVAPVSFDAMGELAKPRLSALPGLMRRVGESNERCVSNPVQSLFRNV